MTRGDRVRITSGDPTTYMRLGRSAAPPEDMTGTVTGTALQQFSGHNITVVGVHWDNDTEGIYFSNALVLEGFPDA